MAKGYLVVKNKNSQIQYMNQSISLKSFMKLTI